MICVSLCLSKLLFSQASYDSSFHFYYYDQKLSFFEKSTVISPDIVWLGDSITDGCEWAELFSNKKCLNRGISADNTFGILNRLYEIVKRKPKKIFIMIGINDIAKEIPDTIILKNYQRIIDTLKIKLPFTKIYFQSLLPTNNNFSEFKNHQNKTQHILYVNEHLEKICKQNKILFVNLYNFFIDNDGKLSAHFTNDGLHLTGDGYKKWKEILQQLKLI